MDLSGCLWLGSGFGYESQWFGYEGLVVTVVWIFWVCSCSPSPSRFWIFWGFEFSYFSGFLFVVQFFPFFFHLVKIYTKHQTQKSNPDFWNIGLNLICWVCVLLILFLLGSKFVVLMGLVFISIFNFFI